MEKAACKFESVRWCDYAARKDGQEVRVATIAGDLRPTLQVFMADKEIQQGILDACDTSDPACTSVSGELMDGFCAACRKVVMASGATKHIWPEKTV
jgi:hypothetical protein